MPVVTAALGWLNDPGALRAFLSTLADHAPTLAGAFGRLRAGEVLARALQGQAGPELRTLGQELLREIGGPLMAAALAAQAAKGKG